MFSKKKRAEDKSKYIESDEDFSSQGISQLKNYSIVGFIFQYNMGKEFSGRNQSQ